jgi:UDP-N-acetylglucosamine 2-epimerase (non-hydrolysing)/GDP/UDP-N,N'-diacetylbacillosamine 2-epimerase (hydrolysing)
LRKITALSGTRAEYGLLKPVLKAINDHPDLELSLIVAGMHLSDRFGNTVSDIERNNFKIKAKIESLVDDDTGAAMAESVGNCLISTVKALEKIKPDILLIIADIGPTLSGAIAGAYMNIPVAHLHGGDLSGSVDDFVRHAITKLSHIHLPATYESAERIRKLGEEEFRIFVVGAPGLDSILNNEFIHSNEIALKYNLDLTKPVLVLIQHPISTELESTEMQIRETMDALISFNNQCVIIYPNADAGGRIIIKTIEEHKQYSFIQIHKSLPHKDYLGLLKVSDVIIGNSSSGLIEAPSFNLPAVNIGSRQKNRQRAKNVIDVEHNKADIIEAINKALSQEFKNEIKDCINPYGDGKTGTKVARILSEIKLDKSLLQKKITY